jgi:histidinol dehydrogenase
LNETDIKIVDLTSLSEEEICKFFEAEKDMFPVELRRSVKNIIDDVARHGDEALVKYTKKYEGIDLSGIKLTEKEIDSCIGAVGEDLRRAIDLAIERVRDFHVHEKVKDWTYTDKLGNTLGKKCTPIERVGIYIPGGKASYPSTLIMTAVPALVAGVKEIAVVSPPSSFDVPSCLALAINKIGGITEVYRVGGVQAVAALAFGTQTIKRVDKLVGPGNIYVTLAKKELYGYVDIDMLAGPSEVLIISDGSVDPRLTAIDLLAQAEHDEAAIAQCVTTSMENAEILRGAIFTLLQRSTRRSIIFAALEKNGRIFVVRDEKCAVAAANAIAPEHLELHTSNPRRLLLDIKNAGAIFLGRYTPEAFGDYIAGPSHVLPTAGTARYFSPLSVLSFMKFSSIIEMSKNGVGELGKYAMVLAEAEGLSSHAHSVRLREEE